MEIVYLGLLSSIFNWIFNKILSPVFSFVSKLLEKVLGWLFNNVLSPLLQEVLWPMFTGLLDLIFSVLAGIIYTIYASFLKIVDSLQQAFNLFAGLSMVTYNNKQYTLLELVFHLDAVQKAMLLITVVGVVMAVMFSALAVSRSIFDMDTENTRPVSKVLGMTLRTMIRFMMVPFMCLFLIMLSGRVLTQVNYAMGGEGNSLARTVWVISSLDAARDADYNMNGKMSETVGINDIYRKPFYEGTKQYYDKNAVKASFKFDKFDYLLGFGGCIFLLVMLATCLLNFVSRIFEVVVLYIASPLFVSVMPLDDGEKFKAWQDMFVAKVFGGYGSVMAMQLYMMICPRVIGGEVSFMEGTVEANYVVKLIFVLGGAWSVIKCGPMITQLLNFQAGSAERETGAVVTGAAMAVGSGIKKRVEKGIEKHKENRAVMKAAKAAQRRDEKAAKKMAMPAEKRAAKEALKAKNQGGSGVPGASGAPGAPGASGGSGAPDALGASGSSGGQDAQGSSGQGIGGQDGAGGQTEKKSKMYAGTTSSFFGGRFRVGTSPDGKSKEFGIHLGKGLTIGRDKEGRRQVSILGLGARMGTDGKIDKISLPCVRLKRNADGKFQVSKIKLGLGSRDSKLGRSVLGGLRIKRTENRSAKDGTTASRTMGGFYFSDFSAINMKRRYSNKTKRIETHQMGGTHYAKGKDGRYRKDYSESFGVRKKYGYTKDKNGREVEFVRSKELTQLGLKMKYRVDEGESRAKLASLKTRGGSQIYKRMKPPKNGNAAGAGASAQSSEERSGE